MGQPSIDDLIFGSVERLIENIKHLGNRSIKISNYVMHCKNLFVIFHFIFRWKLYC